VCDALKGVLADPLSALLTTLQSTLDPYVGQNHIPLDPLEGERAVAAAVSRKDVDLVNFNTNKWVKMVDADLVDGMLGAPQDKDWLVAGPKINQYVNDLTGGSGELDLAVGRLFADGGTVFSAATTIMDVSIRVVNVWLGGLNTFTTFNPMNVLSNFTLYHEMALAELDGIVDIEIALSSPTGTGAVVQPGVKVAPVTELVKVKTGMTDLFVNASTFLAFDNDRVNALQLGSIFATPYECIFSTLYAGNITSLRMTLRDILAPSYGPFSATGEGIGRMVKSLTDAAFVMYESTLLKAAPAMFETTLRGAANDALTTFLDQPFAARCPNNITYPVGREHSGASSGDRDAGTRSSSAGGGGGGNNAGGNDGEGQGDTGGGNGIHYFDFNSSEYVTMLRDLVSGFVANKTEDEQLSGLNEAVVDGLTNTTGTPGTLSWPLALNVNASAGPLGVIVIKIENVSLRNLNTVHDVVALEPIAAHELHNEFKMGTPRPLLFYADILLDISGGESLNLHNHFSVGAGLHDLSAVLDLVLFLDMIKVKMLRLDQVMIYQCWIAALGGAFISKANATFDRFSLDIDCEMCTSPGE
jgi:hypothetical protein